LEQRAHLYTLAGVCALPRALSPHRELSPRSDIGGFAADRGSYTSPATLARLPFCVLAESEHLASQAINEWDGMTHDYTHKGGVIHSEIMLPPHAPLSFSDRSTLWNSVELYEKAGNAQLAR